MERVVFDRMTSCDEAHWWYVARRRVLAALIAREWRGDGKLRILEVGCGTGHNLPMLARFGSVDAIEIDPAARTVAESRLGKRIFETPLPELTGIPDGSYDLIALFDVLEHVEDDKAALRAIKRKLRPGGRLLLTVPANLWMWSAHDVAHHHFRRYSKASLRSTLGDSGLKISMLSHFNTLLFPLIAGVRLVGRVMDRDTADDAMPHPLVNRLLLTVFGAERHLLGKVPLPFGVSLVAVCLRENG